MSELFIAMCDVCFYVDGDERQKPVTYCERCEANICEVCINKRFRRLYAMLKRKISLRSGVLFALFLMCSVLSFSQTPPPPSAFESPYCASGSSPLPPNGWTADPTNPGKFWAVICIDSTGKPSFPSVSSGGTPGGLNGNIQGNNSGAFGGIPGSTSDFVNGLIGLAPTGTGVALTLTGDSSSSNIQNWNALGSSSNPNMFAQSSGSGNIILNWQNDAGSSASMDPNGGLFLFNPSVGDVILQTNSGLGGGNALQGVNLTIVPNGSTKNYNGGTAVPALAINGDNQSSDIQDWNSHTGTLLGKVNFEADEIMSSYFGKIFTSADIAGDHFNISGCTATFGNGGPSAGTFSSGTSGTCTVTITMGGGAQTNSGYACWINDLTTPADTLHQVFTGSTTQVSFTGTTVSGDLINFGCMGY